MGLYQSNVSLVNQTFVLANVGNNFSPSFSAANWSGGVLYTTIGAVTGTSPTLQVVVQLGMQSVPGGAITWATAPTLTNSLGALTSAGGLSVAQFTPSANSGPVATTVGTVYGGNLFRLNVIVGGTGAVSIPVTLSLDMLKRFGDNS